MKQVEWIEFQKNAQKEDKRNFDQRVNRWNAEWQEMIQKKRLIEHAMAETANKIVNDGRFFESTYDTGLTLIAENGNRYRVGIIIKLDDEMHNDTNETKNAE